MAPVYDFRHVELDKIGRGKRIVKPPGGECSNIFGETGQEEQVLTPRKTHNYLQSNIFSPDSPDSPTNGSNGHTTPVKPLDTQDRLFGGSPGDEDTPRRIVNRQRSSIFEQEVVDSRPQSLKNGRRSNAANYPIVGEHVHENGATPNGSHTPNGRMSAGSPILNGGTPNGGTSNGGTPNGNGYLNGHHNGHSSPESPMNGGGRTRVPPGGKSSGIF